jgi:3-phenylpropionate/trans-cinnamate dioxygenase ferredoxin subunit
MADEGEFFPIARTSDIAPGKCEPFMVEGHDILVAQTKAGEFYALRNLCSHANAKMEGGRVRGNHVMCPLHGARFDLRDGSHGPPAFAPIKTYELRVDGDQIEVLITGPPEKPAASAMGMF